MCGIAGVYTANSPIEISDLKKMTDIISHRGPDGEGHWLNSNENVGFGHRRLSIIDLSDIAKQPMHYLNGRFTITFNGEIYNYIELREKLVKKGMTFKSNSDTEVLLALYADKGPKCLEDLDGMFSFAIWDEQDKTLFCARDRFGEKPFYFHYNPRQKFVFCSEIKQLFAYGIPKVTNNLTAYNFLSNRFMVSDPGKRSSTFFEGINKLEPGHCILIDSQLNLKKWKYWDLDLSKENKSISLEESIERFQYLFERSVRRRLRSDVPVGSSLSGGLDSSTIVCLIDKINKDNRISQKTFSARFKNFSKDEGVYMQAVVSRTKAEAHYTWPEENGFVADLDNVIHHQDEPFASASIYAQWCVMKLAKQENVTVLIDGQGADESLAGYVYFFIPYLHELFKSGSDLYVQELNAYRKMHNPDFHDLRIQNDISAPELSFLSKLKDTAKDIVRPAYRTFRPLKQSPLIKPEPLLTTEFTSEFAAEDLFNRPMSGSLKEELYWNACNFGLEDLLRYADRNSMAFSREVRLPFLDHELVEFIFSLPSTHKINKGWTKYVLRKAFENIMPPEISWRVDKIGYEPPQAQWMRNSVVSEMIQDAKSHLIKEKILNPKREESKDDDWCLLMAGKMLYS